MAAALRDDLYDWRARDGARAVGPGDELLEVQHQSLVACLLTATDAASPAWSAYLGRDGGAVVETLAASGAQVLAASALDGYLDLARDWWDDAPATWVRAAIDSVHALAGTWIDEWEEDADVDAWADEARAAVAAAGTPYVHRGRPLSAATVGRSAVAGVARAVASGRPAAVVELEDLSTWSGAMAPRLPRDRPATAADAAAVEEYVAVVLALPWRDGVKYFYGHDVDGGPGLHP